MCAHSEGWGCSCGLCDKGGQRIDWCRSCSYNVIHLYTCYTYLCTCIYTILTYTGLYIYVHVYTHIYTHLTHAHTCMFNTLAHIHIYMHRYFKCTYEYIHIHVCVHIHIYSYMNNTSYAPTHTYIHIHIHKHPDTTHIYSLFCHP